eukprot:3624338-Amphidinium_carterae.2
MCIWTARSHSGLVELASCRAFADLHHRAQANNQICLYMAILIVKSSTGTRLLFDRLHQPPLVSRPHGLSHACYKGLLSRLASTWTPRKPESKQRIAHLSYASYVVADDSRESWPSYQSEDLNVRHTSQHTASSPGLGNMLVMA